MSAIASPSTNRRLISGWAATALVWAALMFTLPGKETIPFHFIWIGLAVVYGFTRWPARDMVAALVVVATVTGVILVHHAAQGFIGWEETAEVPLMAALFGVMVWHVRRRNHALAEVSAHTNAHAQQTIRTVALQRAGDKWKVCDAGVGAGVK